MLNEADRGDKPADLESSVADALAYACLMHESEIAGRLFRVWSRLAPCQLHLDS
jgi:hypothetical protein